MKAAIPLSPKGLYEFGPFRLDCAKHLLLKDSESLPLTPKAFEILALLVEKRGALVTKGELLNAVWPNTFVEENNLTQYVSLLRKTLGDEAEDQKYIQTVPRLGYRLVSDVRLIVDCEPSVLVAKHTHTRVVMREEREEVREEDQELAEADATAESAALVSSSLSMPTKLTMIRKWMVVVAVSFICLAAAYLFVERGRKPVPQPNAPRTLAILPFRDLKPEGDSQFLSYSLADAIIHRLGYFNEIVVRPSSYVAKYRGGEADPRAVAQELHVEAVLTGNYIRENNRLRVSAELIDVHRAEVLWRDTLEVPYGQLLTVQDRVAENVVRGLRVQMLPQLASRLKETAPRNALAYEYFLRGRDFGTPNDYRFSIQMLEKSVELDPNYAPAWMELGSAYVAYASWQGGEAAFTEKGRAAFSKALELDPQLPDAHVLMAVQMMEHGELEKGLLTLREELRIDPNEPMAHWWLTEAYLYGGMLEESIAEGERALNLDPLINGGSTFNSYLHAGDYEKFLSTLPVGESARTSFYRGLCFFYMQNNSRAATEFESAYSLDPSLLHAKYGRAFLYAIRNQPAEGRRYLKELERANPTADGEMLYKMAQAYATLGDTASALRLLRATIDHGFYCHACFIRDPLMTSLHGERQYVDLLDLAYDRHERFKHQYF